MKKPSNKAKINLKNIKRFVKGYTRMFSSSFGMLDKHQQEQVVWRTTKASECFANGSCTFCGCDTPAKFYSDEGCEDPVKKCYPAMMDEVTWEMYKIANLIKIKID